MTWQENLRELDQRLANGDISANEYRRTRDEILAEASSSSSPDSKQDVWLPAQDAAKDAGENAETDAKQDPGETTIVVKTSQVEEDTQIVSSDSIAPAPSPAVPAVPPPPPPPGPAAPPPPPYPVAPIQGHEVFAEASAKKSGALTRFLVPLLILALVGAGVWWFFLRDSGDGNPAATPPPTSTAAKEKAHDVDAVAGLLPELPGKANANNGTLTLDRARELKLFTKNYATLLGDKGAEQIVYRGAVQRGVGYLLVASPVESAEAAAGVVEATTAHLERAGFKQAPEVSPDDPKVITRTDRAFRTFIAVYASDNVWVQLNVSGPPDGDEEELRTEFQKVLGSLTERLPAD
jgi:hypothetical protein